MKDKLLDIADRLRGSGAGRSSDDRKLARLGVPLLVVLLVLIVIGIYWSAEPDRFDVREAAAQHAPETSSKLTTGSYTTSAVIATMETLLNKRGGYLSNDIMPPSVWLDNIPNWEFGALVQVRDMARSLRNDFSRSQSQSAEDEDLIIAEPQFHIDNESWILPSSESEYQTGIDALYRFLGRLKILKNRTRNSTRARTTCRNGSARWKNASAACRSASAPASARCASTRTSPGKRTRSNPPPPVRR